MVYVLVPDFFLTAIVVCWRELPQYGSGTLFSVVIATQNPEHNMYYDSYSSYSARRFPQMQAKRLEIARLAGLAINFNIGTTLLDW